VKQLADAMTAVGLDDGESVLVDILRNYIAYVPVHGSRLAHLDGFLKAHVRLLNQEFRRFRHLPHEVTLIQVNMESLIEHCHVQVHNVAIL
jgi:hypothetical protein